MEERAQQATRWAQESLGNKETAKALKPRNGEALPLAIRRELDLANHGLDGQAARLGSNRVMQRVMRDGSVPATDDADIASSLGAPLPDVHRQRMERAFDHPFPHVKVHTDGTAAQASRNLSARAFTLGADIFFGPGEWAPGTPQGDRLLAHELTHVVQHDEGRIGTGPRVSTPDEPLEQEAYANEDVILGQLPDVADLAPAAPVAAPTPMFEARAADLGAGEFSAMREATPAVGGTQLPDKVTLNIGGVSIDVKMPGSAAENKVTVALNRELVPGVTLIDAKLEFTDDWELEKGTLRVLVVIGDWVNQSADLAITAVGDAESKIGQVQSTIEDLALKVGELIDTTCDVLVAASQVTATAVVQAENILLPGGLILTGGELRLMASINGLVGNGTLHGTVPGVGSFDLQATLDNLDLDGSITLHCDPLNPLPELNIDPSDLTGPWLPTGFEVQGQVQVAFRDNFRGSIGGSYKWPDNLWSVNGRLDSTVAIQAGPITLSNPSVGLEVKDSTLVAVHLAGTLETERFSGTFDGGYEPVGGLLSGVARVQVLQPIPLGPIGVLQSGDGELTLQDNVPKRLKGNCVADLNWNGKPAFHVEVLDGDLDLEHNTVSGFAQVTTIGEVTFGNRDSLNVRVADQSTVSAQLTENAVDASDGGLAFEVWDGPKKQGAGTLAFKYAADTGFSGDAAMEFHDKWGLPDREAGPLYLHAGSVIQAKVVENDLTKVTLTNVEYTLESFTGGSIVGRANGTWQESTGVTGHIDGTVDKVFNLRVPRARLTLLHGGYAKADIVENDVKMLDVDVNFDASLELQQDYRVEGRFKGQTDPKSGKFKGKAAGALVNDLTWQMKSGAGLQLKGGGETALMVDFDEDGIKKVGVDGTAIILKGGAPYLTGHIEDGTYDVGSGDIGFKGDMKLHQPYSKTTKDGKYTIKVKENADLHVEVAASAIDKLGGNIEYELHDKDGGLLEGSFKDVLLDFENLEFTGAWAAKTMRPFVHPRQGKGDKDMPGLRLTVDQGAGTSGRVEKNDLKQVKANLSFKVDLLEQPLAEGKADVDWNLAEDLFTGGGFFQLEDNFPLKRKAKPGTGGKIEDWTLWLHRGSKLDVYMQENVLQRAEIDVAASVQRDQTEQLAVGEIKGQYKPGDEQKGFDGHAFMDVQKRLPWSDGDHFSTVVLPETHLDVNVAQSVLGESHGAFGMEANQVGSKGQVTVHAKGDYLPKKGVTANGTLDVVNELRFPGADYEVKVTQGSGVSAQVVEDDLTHAKGNVTAFAGEVGAKPFIEAHFDGEYKGGTEQTFGGKGQFRIIENKDLGARSSDYRVTLNMGAGTEVEIADSDLQAMHGHIPITVSHKEQGPLADVDLQGDYIHEDKEFTGDGTAKLHHRITIAENVGPRSWSFYLERESQAEVAVDANDLEKVHGVLRVTVEEGKRPFLQIDAQGEYKDDGTVQILNGGARILRRLPIFEGKAYEVFLRKDGEARVWVGASGVEKLGGKVGIEVHKAGKPFADVDLEGSWTDKEGFDGHGKAKLYEPIGLDLGKYDVAIDPNDSFDADVGLDGGDITEIGGTLKFRMDEDGVLRLDDPRQKTFMRGEISGHYDFKTFTGKGWAAIETSKKLATADGEELWLLAPTRVSVDIKANDLKNIGGGVHLELRDTDGGYLKVDFESGGFDAAGGTGFTGQGSAHVTRRKLLYGKDGTGYSFWLDANPAAAARAAIKENKITEVTANVPFLVKDDGKEFIEGVVDGRYAKGKLTGKGNVKLSRDKDYPLGRDGTVVSLKQGSGGDGQVTNSRLERLGGILTAEYKPKGKKLMTLVAKGEFDAVNRRIAYLQGSMKMDRPLELLGGEVVITEAAGEARLENNDLKHAWARGAVKVKRLKDAGGWFKAHWKNEGGEESYWGDGELNFDLIQNRSKKRSGKVEKIKAALDQAGKLVAATRFFYQMSELIGGWVDVTVDERLDPEVKGSFQSKGPLVKGGPLFGMHLPEWRLPKLPLGFPGLMFAAGAKAGMALETKDLTYAAEVILPSWRPISQGLDVPKFSADLTLDWGAKFEAQAAAWAQVELDAVVASLAMGIKGGIDVGVDLSVTPFGRIYGESGGLHGEVGMGFNVEPTAKFTATPFVEAKVPLIDPIKEDFDGVLVDLGSLFSVSWTTVSEFGDSQGKKEGPAVAPQKPPTQEKTDQKHVDEPKMDIPESQGRLPQVPGGPQVESGSAVKGQQEGGGLEEKLGGLKKTLDTIKKISEGLAALDYFVDLISSMIKWFERFGIVGLIVYLVWKIIIRDLSWDKIKSAAIAVWEGAKAAGPLLYKALPKTFQGLVDRLSGDKPGLLDALFGADDEMRDAVRKRHEHEYAPAEMRVKMINEMMSGYCSEDDEECIVLVLQVSDDKFHDFPWVARNCSGGPDRIMNELDGVDDTKASKLMKKHGISYSTGW